MGPILVRHAGEVALGVPSIGVSCEFLFIATIAHELKGRLLERVQSPAGCVALYEQRDALGSPPIPLTDREGIGRLPGKYPLTCRDLRTRPQPAA